MKRLFTNKNGEVIVKCTHKRYFPLKLYYENFHEVQKYLYENSSCGLTKGFYITKTEAREVRIELLQRGIKILPEFKNKKERNRDIKWLFYNNKISTIKKTEITTMFGISLSQFYRILKQPSRKARTKKITRSHSQAKIDYDKKLRNDIIMQNVPSIVLDYAKRYHCITEVKAGNKDFSDKYITNVRDKYYPNERRKIFQDCDALFETLPHKLEPLQLFFFLYNKHKDIFNTDVLIARELRISPSQVRVIRCFNLLKITTYATEIERNNDIQQMIKMHFAYRMFLKRKKRFQKISTSQKLLCSIERISEIFKIPCYQLYRKFKIKELKSECFQNLPKTYMVIKIDDIWFDIDTFLQSYPAEIQKIHFPQPQPQLQTVK